MRSDAHHGGRTLGLPRFGGPDHRSAVCTSPRTTSGWLGLLPTLLISLGLAIIGMIGGAC